jgi:multiple sugar transport system substrate-binding protein
MSTPIFFRTVALILGVMLSLIIISCGAASAPAPQEPAAPAQAEEAAQPAATEEPAAVSEDTGGEAATITFWSRNEAQFLVEPVVNAWNASHKTQIKATFFPHDEFIPKFSAAIAAGETPDLVAVDLVFMPAFMAADQMTDITDLAKSLPFYDKLSPQHMRLGTYKDRIYSVPFNADGSALMYNKKLFKQAGLDPEKPPTTWAEMAEYSAKITALGDDAYGFYFSGSCSGCNEFTLMPYIWASGGDMLNEDGTQATVTDPRVKDLLEFLHERWVNKEIPESAKADNGADFFNAFAAGNIGMVGTGTFAISKLKKEYPDIEFGLAPFPGKDGGQSSFAGGDTIAIPKGSEYVNEAFEFMTWFLSEEVQLEQIAKNDGLPLRSDLLENEYTIKDPRYGVVAETMYEGRTVYAEQCNLLFNDASSPWLAMLQRAIFDGEINEAIAEAQERFTEIIEQ